MIKCTHNCETCKCKIVDSYGYDICNFISLRDDEGSKETLITGYNELSSAACEELMIRGQNYLYIYPDGLYIFSPIMSIKRKENYKLIKKVDKNEFYWERKDENWVLENAKKGL